MHKKNLILLNINIIGAKYLIYCLYYQILFKYYYLNNIVVYSVCYNINTDVFAYIKRIKIYKPKDIVNSSFNKTKYF